MMTDIPEPRLEPQEAAPRCICPVCGDECGKLYKDLYGSIVGCDVCIEEVAPDA